MVYNNTIFRGQYEEALIKICLGGDISRHDFHNGKYEATTPFKHFMSLLDKAHFNYEFISDKKSLRSGVIKKLEGFEEE